MVRGRQTGCLANSTVDIGDNPARPADDVMVVVADPGLVARDGDTGTTLGEATAIAADVKQIAGCQVTHVVLTHKHFDHVLGSSVFDQAEVFCARGHS